jgi:hypothetical protein
MRVEVDTRLSFDDLGLKSFVNMVEGRQVTLMDGNDGFFKSSLAVGVREKVTRQALGPHPA